VAVVGYTCIKTGKRQLYTYTRGETMYKTAQKHRIHKIENEYTEQENKNYKNIKKYINRVIRK
jgi:hypothetical protein